jgi:hypothetical protein
MGRIKQILAILVLASPWQVASVAAAEDVSGLDCAAVLESYAANPKAVPKSVADACQQAINIAPGAGSPKQPLVLAPQAVDPCSGPGAQSSVQCWGPWLAPPQPLAGPTLPAQDLTPFDEPRPELLALDVDPPSPVDPPVTPCAPGLPCGFATVVTGTQNIAPASETIFARFDLAQDGSEFGVDPANGDPEIDSVTGMNTIYTSRPDQFENMRASGADGDLRSRLVARVLRQGQDIQISGDIWANGNVATGEANSGFYAWGIAATQADLDALTNMGATLNFSGPMSVNNATSANISLSYAATPSWTGNWTNPAYAFSAGGNVTGANFLSDPTQFSSNVQDGFVQGALVGPAGSRAVANIIEVTLDGHGLVRDVGLLAETVVP